MKHIIATVTNDLSYDQRMIKTCNTLVNNGYKVTLIGRKLPNSIPLEQEKFKQVRLGLLFKKGKLFYLEYNITLFCYLLFASFDAICSVDMDSILPGLLASRIKGKKVIYDAHEYFSELPEVVERPKIKELWQKVENYSIPKVNAAYTVSNGIAEILSNKHKIPFKVIKNVPYLNEQHEIASTSEKYIWYQGALNVGRGIEEMILAMHRVDAHFKIAGDGPIANQLKAMVKKEGLEGKIEFLGFVKPTALKVLTENATIGVNLAQNLGLSYYYSLNNKFFDYIHAGLPQLCINFPEFKYVNDAYNIAVLVDDLSPDKLSNEINKMLLNNNLYTSIKSNCVKAKQELNWEQESVKLLNIYKAVLNG